MVEATILTADCKSNGKCRVTTAWLEESGGWKKKGSGGIVAEQMAYKLSIGNVTEDVCEEGAQKGL